MGKPHSSLNKYIFWRLLQFVPAVIGVLTLIFILIHAAPGDPVFTLVGEAGGSADYYEMVRREFGLDRSLFYQLMVFYRQMAGSNLGYSYVFGQPVISVIMERIPATLLLMGTQLILSILIGVTLGVTAARFPHSALDYLATSVAVSGQSIPVFWLCQLLILLFAVKLEWFPLQGMVSLRQQFAGFRHILDIGHHLVLPMFSLALLHLAMIARLTRATMLEVLQLEYILVAKAKGLPEWTVVWWHGLRNAILPVVTVVGMNISMMLAGAVLTETVFSWPGLGRLLYESIGARDYPVLMGMFLIVCLSVIFANLLVDITYVYLDPRVRFGSQK